VTRRRFLALALAAVAGAFGLRRVTSSADDSPTRRLADALGDRDAARAVGERYLAERPGEADEARLVRLLAPLGDASALSADELARRVRDAVHEDFVRGRVVTVDGWYLSRTEARLCALSTLT
jgi:hypothetical protein